MAQFESWPEPLPFIESTEEGGLYINKKTAALISQVKVPVVVVAVSGTYRSGKSYLMNRLARKKTGFPLGSTVQAMTKGIWAWCLQHTDDVNQALILLDTEGLNDVAKGDAQHDMKILTLAVLLSSTFIFNTMAQINQEMIDKLSFVTVLTDNINVKRQKGNDDECDLSGSRFEEYTTHFPHFVLVVRDFMLGLVLDGREVSPCEYFEHTLKLKTGNNTKVVLFNLPREAIRNAFKSYDCFVFVRPVEKDELFKELELVQEEQLVPKFKEQSEEFYRHVLQKSQPKKLVDQQVLIGQTFVDLTEAYLESIAKGGVPCIESTVALVADSTNRRLQDECEKKYLEVLERLAYPVSEETLAALHRDAYAQAMENFRRDAIFDKEGVLFHQMAERITKAFNTLVHRNKSASTRRCMQAIESLYCSIIKENIQNHKYMTVGGYKLYDDDMKKVVTQYKALPELGPMRDEVLSEFLAQREVERNTILGADSKLSDREKEIETQKKKAEAAKMLKEAAEKEIKAQEERIKALRKEHEEQANKISEDFKKKEEESKKEMEQLLNKRLEEQKRLLTEKHETKAKEKEEEIAALRSQIDIHKSIERVCHVVGKLAEVVNAIAPLVDKHLERKATKESLKSGAESSARAGAEGGAKTGAEGGAKTGAEGVVKSSAGSTGATGTQNPTKNVETNKSPTVSESVKTPKLDSNVSASATKSNSKPSIKLPDKSTPSQPASTTSTTKPKSESSVHSPTGDDAGSKGSKK